MVLVEEVLEEEAQVEVGKSFKYNAGSVRHFSYYDICLIQKIVLIIENSTKSGLLPLCNGYSHRLNIPDSTLLIRIISYNFAAINSHSRNFYINGTF